MPLIGRLPARHVLIIVVLVALPRRGDRLRAWAPATRCRRSARAHFALEQDFPQSSGGPVHAVSAEVREEEIRQMLQARSDRGVAKGREALDVEAEVEKLLAADIGGPALGADAGCARRCASWWSPGTSAASGRARSRSTSSRRSSASCASSRTSVNKMPRVEASDAEKRVIELEELLTSPGTYFNPQTEVVVVVDDSASIDQEVFNMEAFEGADWVRISDEVPVDEDQRDQLLEEFQTHYHPGSSRLGLRDRARAGRRGARRGRGRPGPGPRGLTVRVGAVPAPLTERR